jgi:hypothetical protein
MWPALYNVGARRIMEAEKKPAVKSWSIWGSVLQVLPLFYLIEKGLDLPSGFVEKIVASGNELYVAALAFIGLVLQVWGRLRANSQISGLFKVKE